MQARTTQDSRQQRLYKQWSNFCATLNINPALQDSSVPRIEVLQVYGHRVRHAQYSKRRVDLLGKELVSQAWGAIAVTHLLAGLPDPRKPTNSQANEGLDMRLSRKRKTYGIEDPPVRREKAIPLGIVHSIVSAANSASDQKTRHTADLVVLVFYFCLRSCEYLKCTSHGRTVQLRPLIDFLFFAGDTLLPQDAPIRWFEHVNQIVLTLDNQNNAIRGETVSQFRSKCPVACPVRAGVNIFLCQQEHGCDPTTTVSDYPTPQGLCSVSAAIVITLLRAKCKRVGAARLGFAPEDIVTHSLRSGGAMAMHIADVPDWTLMNIESWHLLGFMIYIQQQISSFSTVVSVRISAQPWFQHI